MASLRLGRRWQVIANYSWVDARNDDRSFATPAVLGGAQAFGNRACRSSTAGRGPRMAAERGLAYVGDRAGSLDARPLVLPAYVKAKAAIEAPVADHLRLRLEATICSTRAMPPVRTVGSGSSPARRGTVRASLRVDI